MDTPVTGERLRAVMRRVPSPVTVVTTEHAGEQRGITIGSFTSVSLDPPLISFNVSREAQVQDALRKEARFAVHVLSSQQAHLSVHFAVPDQSGAEQFEPVAHRLDAHGIPILEGVAVVLHCRFQAAFEVAGGDMIFIGQVVGVEEEEDLQPLLYYQQAYHEVGSEVTSNLFSPVKRSSSETS